MSSGTGTQPSVKPTPESAFYDNLTLGLLRLLANTPRIANVTLDKRPPCERTHVSTWEQRHNVYLPDDMKRFYLSTDGFTLHWSYQYSPEDLLRVGFLSFPQLSQIALLRESIETFIGRPASGQPSASTTATASSAPKAHTASSSTNNAATNATTTPMPQLTSRSKIFELSSICDLAKVCLVYENPECNVPKIFLLTNATLRWHFLADTFTEYHRMAIVHLGLPSWELCFSSACPLPSWTEQLFLLLAPHLLEKTEARRSRNLSLTQPQPPYNQLDASIFRTTKPPKASATTTTTVSGTGAMRGANHGRNGARGNMS